MNRMKHYALLCEGLQYQQMEIVEELLFYDCPVNLKGIRRQNTPLHWACSHANEEIVRTLLSCRANVNATNSRGEMPLHSIFSADGETISNLRSVPKRFLLQKYISEKIIQIVKLLVKSGCDVNAKNDGGYSALHLAAQNGYDLAVEYLIQNGAEINSRSATCFLTPLHLAVMAEQLNTVKILLKFGADVNIGYDTGVTPLNCAVITGNAAIVKTLLSYSHDTVDVFDRSNRRPLMYAIENNNVDVANLLIRANASLNNLGTSLHLALNRTFKSVLILLLENGADANSRDEDGATLLWNAVYRKWDDRFLGLLVEKGADIHAVKTDTGATILMAATLGRNYEFAQYLVRKGADVKASDVKGFTPLHVMASRLASAQDDTFNIRLITDTLLLLLDSGADVNAKTKCGRTPLSYHGPNRALEKELLKYMARMKTINRHISKRNIKIIESKERLNDFYQKCLEELRNAQNTTFCKLLSETDGNRLASYVRNTGMRKIVTSYEFDDNFPIYGADVKASYIKGEERRILLDAGQSQLNVACKSQLPWNVCQQIVHHLSREDLVNLSSAFCT